MKKKSRIISIMFFMSIMIPTVLSSFATLYTSVTLLIITIVIMFLMLKIPIFKHRENLWMFVITTFTTIPVNIFLVKIINESVFFNYGNTATKVFRGFVIYAVLFAIEQILLGIITRFIFRRQYQIFIDIEEIL